MSRRIEAFSCRIYGVLTRRARGRTEVLLTRSLFFDKEFVNFPGGGIELGEAPADALKREFSEETGLRIAPVRALHASAGLHVSTVRPWQLVSMFWLVRRRGGRLRRGSNGSDVRETFWAEVGNVPTSEMYPADREFVRLLPNLLSSCP
jgi:8-oxo-dGTP pyrophosphatase MutT (NUDIX family)